jgi:hypothetical protein
MNRLLLLAPMASAAAWLFVEGGWVYFSDYYFPASRPEGLLQMAVGILVGVPVVLAWVHPRRFVFVLAVLLSIVASVPSIANNVLFANEYGWEVGGRHVAISLCFGVLLAVACVCLRRFVQPQPAQTVTPNSAARPEPLKQRSLWHPSSRRPGGRER